MICQLQNTKSNFPKFCKVYARQNLQTNLIHLHVHLVETTALLLYSKVVFEKLFWFKLSKLKNTQLALNPLIPRGNKTYLNKPTPFSCRFGEASMTFFITGH